MVKDFTPGLPKLSDESGHGSHLAGIIGGQVEHIGYAPDAHFVALKVLRGSSGSGRLEWTARALNWVVRNYQRHNISVVAVASGDGRCHLDDSALTNEPIYRAITELERCRVAVVAPAGNGFTKHLGQPGLAFPAICQRAISVAGLFYSSLGWALTESSQRLPEQVDICAPAGPFRSACHTGEQGSKVSEGTSQAMACVAGTIALLQEAYKTHVGLLPEIEDLKRWLKLGGRILSGYRAQGYRSLEVEDTLSVLYRELDQRILYRPRSAGETITLMDRKESYV